MSKQLTYLDFAQDELSFLTKAYIRGMRDNPMVSMSQRVIELYFKHLLSLKLLNNAPSMSGHNLRALYDDVANAGYDLREIRPDVMTLNNFYTHTRYPGKESYLATPEDVEAAFHAVHNIVVLVSRFL